MKRLVAALSAMMIMASGLSAQESGRDLSFIGFGQLLTNDIIGDRKDRWRTGSYQASLVWGPEWSGRLPGRFGDLLELRFGGEIITPADLSRVVPDDRPYAGILSLGLHSHFAYAGLENSIGLDIAVTGPQTGLDDFQSFLHNTFNGPKLSSAVRDQQVEDGVHPTLVVESGRSIHLSSGAEIRPFFEGRIGLESLARAGADITLGQVGRNALMIREAVTGQRYRTVADGFEGLALVLGGDVAYVHSSALLPGDSGVTPEEYRTRLRTGIHWQPRRGISGFYGLTWLSEEFTAQKDSQIVGSIRLSIDF